MAEAAKETNPETRKTLEKIALRHYEEATKGIDGVITNQMKVLAAMHEKYGNDL